MSFAGQIITARRWHGQRDSLHVANGERPQLGQAGLDVDRFFHFKNTIQWVLLALPQRLPMR
jgi:hypothetical protein